MHVFENLKGGVGDLVMHASTLYSSSHIVSEGQQAEIQGKLIKY